LLRTIPKVIHEISTSRGRPKGAKGEELITDDMRAKLLPLLPTSTSSLLRRSVRRIGYSRKYDILDIGCGDGEKIELIDPAARYRTVGIDLSPSRLIKAKRRGVYEDCVACDANHIPFIERSFTTVLCAHTIEHLEKRLGVMLISRLQGMADRQVIITTPVGYLDVDEFVEDPLMKHKSGYTPKEMRSMGFHVRGQGIFFWRYLYGRKGLTKIFPPPLTYFALVLFYLLEPIAHAFPVVAVHMFCVRRMPGSFVGNSRENVSP
jgi:SAM-dependent methyltransferase